LSGVQFKLYDVQLEVVMTTRTRPAGDQKPRRRRSLGRFAVPLFSVALILRASTLSSGTLATLLLPTLIGCAWMLTHDN
jgi:hypothetical protein